MSWYIQSYFSSNNRLMTRWYNIKLSTWYLLLLHLIWYFQHDISCMILPTFSFFSKNFDLLLITFCVYVRYSQNDIIMYTLYTTFNGCFLLVSWYLILCIWNFLYFLLLWYTQELGMSVFRQCYFLCQNIACFHKERKSA